MERFSNDREALDFMASQIADEAKREGVSLSDVERKMLYFSETAWTLPDMAEVNEEFDSNYDQGEFERKIAGVVRNIQRAPMPDKGEEPSWDKAVHVLRSEDHYLLVL